MQPSTGRHRYRPLPDDDMEGSDNGRKPAAAVANDEEVDDGILVKRQWWTRSSYPGALLFNAAAFILPAVYETLSKLWVAGIDSSMVATTDTYTYISVMAEVLNEGLPRAAFLIIGDKSSRSISERLRLSWTMIYFQTILGAIMSAAICTAAERFANAFVPEVKRDSIEYIRIGAWSTLFGAVDVAVSACTRALDRPDVPLVISTVKTAIKIILELIILSSVRVHINVKVTMQAVIRLSCDAAGALAGLLYFVYTARKLQNLSSQQQGELITEESSSSQKNPRKPSLPALITLARPGFYTFIESAIRNILYLWLVSGIVAMGTTYATAWGVFNTIRWGLIMVPVQSLEATSSTFVGHAWGIFRARTGRDARRPKASKKDLVEITRPAFLSAGIALAIEIPVCIALSVGGARGFAYYLSKDDKVADVTAYMWRSIDWCYIFYALSTQLATILLSTRPSWYLFQSLCSNLLWVLPWAIAVTKLDIDETTAWKWHSIVFGGSLVVSFGIVVAVVGAWAWRLRKGISRLEVVERG